MTAPLFDLLAFAQLVAARLQLLGLSVRAAGEAIGVSGPTVSRAARAAPSLDVESWMRINRWLDETQPEALRKVA